MQISPESIVISLLIILASIAVVGIVAMVIKDHKRKDPPRYIKLSHQLYAMMFYNRAGIFCQWDPQIDKYLRFTNWDYGLAESTRKFKFGDILLVKGKRGSVYGLMIMSCRLHSANPTTFKIETTFVGYISRIEGGVSQYAEKFDKVIASIYRKFPKGNT